MENFLLGLGDVFNQTSLAFMLFGVVCGIVVGAVPGLSGPMAIALCIPLTYYMTPVGAVGFLVGINKGGTFGGSIASILLNTPGSPESAATCYDGYPLALQRKGEKALKISLFASFFGDTISAISLVLLSVPLASVALKLAPPISARLFCSLWCWYPGWTPAPCPRGLSRERSACCSAASGLIRSAVSRAWISAYFN